MSIDEYQTSAAFFINKDLTTYQQMCHSLHGMSSEIGELHDIYQKVYQGHPINPEHIDKELGDILWMLAEYCTVTNRSLNDIAQLNLDKLKNRYPNGFEIEKSINRDPNDI